MTGYQEVLTDPSYAGQMVCMTYPLQGNYGVRGVDAESARPWARALVVRWACPAPSHHSSEASLDQYLRRWNVPAIAEIGQGLMNRSAWDIGKPGSTTFKINEMYKAKTGRDLDDTSGRNMQAALAMAEATNRGGSTDPAKLQAALKATDLKSEQLMMGYRGVKYDETGQNILASTYLIQLKAKQYELVWPESAAQAKLEWPMKGWK